MNQVFLAKVDTPRGPMLRVYEYDRYNGTVWQVSSYNSSSIGCGNNSSGGSGSSSGSSSVSTNGSSSSGGGEKK